MKLFPRSLSALAALTATLCTFGAAKALAQVPAGYPADYAKVVEAAHREGKVVVYSVLGNKAAAPLVAGFKAMYPGIKVEYDGESGTNEITERFLIEVKQGSSSADVMWSSAMDLQMMLVRDGHAARYESPEAQHLPAWARWRNQAWGTTFEPVVMVYNKKLVPDNEVPHDRAALTKLLTERADKFDGKVAMFDIDKSGVGYMFATQDDALGQQRLPALLKALGRTGVHESGGTGEMLAKVNSGEYLFGYNIMGAYALERSKKELPSLGVVLPRDYTLVLSRVMFISKHTKHPNAARLWADYMLSQRGQRIIGDAIGLYAVRDDVDAEHTATKLAKGIGSAARPIPIDPKIAGALDQRQQREFIVNWKTALVAAR